MGSSWNDLISVCERRASISKNLLKFGEIEMQTLLKFITFSGTASNRAYNDPNQFIAFEEMILAILGESKCQLIKKKWPSFVARSKHVYEKVYLVILKSLVIPNGNAEERKGFVKLWKNISKNYDMNKINYVLDCPSSNYPMIDGVALGKELFEKAATRFGEKINAHPGMKQWESWKRVIVNQCFDNLQDAVKLNMRRSNSGSSKMDTFGVNDLVGIQVKVGLSRIRSRNLTRTTDHPPLLE